MSSSEPKSLRKPNVVILLCDDLGHGDIGCYGNPIIQTPNLDALAAEGTRFTDCYAAAPVCSASRAGLLTGRDPNRVGVYDWIGSQSVMHMARHEFTIPTLLKGAGYDTCLVGKWHLNCQFNAPAEPSPGDQGFDHWFATANNAFPSHHNPENFVRNGRSVGQIEGYSSSIVVEEGIRWLENRKDPDEPFFMLVAFHEPHEPIASPPRFVQRYADVAELRGQDLYYANVTQIDHAVGQLLAALDEMGLAEDTLIFFTSDNGPEAWMRYPGAWRSHGTPGSVKGKPLRGMKLHIEEGGIRVPGILRWPAGVAPGQICQTPISGVDWLPTCCALAGVKPPDDRALDGENILPLLSGNEWVRREAIFWFYYNARGYANMGLREGDYSLLARRTMGDYRAGTSFVPERIAAVKLCRPRSPQLFNLRKDVTQTYDLAEEEPDRFADMYDQLQRRLQAVQDEAPVW